MAVAYDGWELESKNRYKLRNKVAVTGFDNSPEFQKRKEGAIASVFNTDEVETRILNGDGGLDKRWINGRNGPLPTGSISFKQRHHTKGQR